MMKKRHNSLSEFLKAEIIWIIGIITLICTTASFWIKIPQFEQDIAVSRDRLTNYSLAYSDIRDASIAWFVYTASATELQYQQRLIAQIPLFTQYKSATAKYPMYPGLEIPIFTEWPDEEKLKERGSLRMYLDTLIRTQIINSFRYLNNSDLHPKNIVEMFYCSMFFMYS